ncbi:MAG: short-subunit dehydrogenase [Verrucomicrobiales bacterium]|jgi:short-subunit dehydrogenase
MDTQEFQKRYGPWAIVTGASSGIGREIAAQLAERGLNLVLVARRREVLEEISADLTEKHKISTRVLDADLGDAAAAGSIDSGTEDLDVGLIVAAAGFGQLGAFLDSSLDRELAMLDLNCRAVLIQSHQFAKRFAKRGRGGIVLFGSIIGFNGAPNAAHYAATKGWVQMLAEALNVELKPKGVDVLAVAPGPTNTEFASEAGMKSGMALKPADVAREALNKLGHRQTSKPGLMTKVILNTTSFLPRWARVSLMGKVMGSQVDKGKH